MYSGVVATPVAYNPLGLVLLAKPAEEPYFSVPLCVIFGLVMIGVGAVRYSLNYDFKKMKYHNAVAKDASKYSFKKLKELI